MTWWRPWWKKPSNGHASSAAQQQAEQKLRDAKAQWPEVHKVTDRFAAEVAAAMSRRQHR
jgi:hypothetical protein